MPFTYIDEAAQPTPKKGGFSYVDDAATPPADINGQRLMMTPPAGGNSTAYLPAGVRIATQIASQEGMLPGAVISGGGEALAQLLEGKLNGPAVLGAGAMGAVPLSGLPRAAGAVARLAQSTPLRMGAGAALGDVVEKTANGEFDPVNALEKGAMAAGTAKGVGLAGEGLQGTVKAIIDRLPASVKDSIPDSVLNAVKSFANSKTAAEVNNANPELYARQDAAIAGNALPNPIKFDPSQVGQGGFRDTLVGSAAMPQEIQRQNVIPVQDAVRTAMGLPARQVTTAAGATRNTINLNDVEAAKKMAIAPYTEVKAISPAAAEDFDKMQKARDDLRKAFIAKDAAVASAPVAGVPDANAAIDAARAAKNAAEDRMKLHALTTDNPALKQPLTDMIEAEKAAAKAQAKFDAYQQQRMSNSSLPNFEKRTLADANNPSRITSANGAVDTASTPLAEISVQEKAAQYDYAQATKRAAEAKAKVDKLTGGDLSSELASRVEAARAKYAQISDFERALGAGELIDMTKLGRAYAPGMWTGTSKILGESATNLPKDFVNPANIKVPDRNALLTMLSLINPATYVAKPVGKLARAYELSAPRQNAVVQKILDNRNGLTLGLDPRIINSVSKAAEAARNQP